MRGEDQPQELSEPTFREFLISFKTMDFRLRALTGIVLAEVVAAVILIAAKSKLLPRLKIETGGSLEFSVPWITYCLAGGAVIAGLTSLTHGLLEATVKGRLLFVGVLLAFFSACILGSFVADPTLLLTVVLMTFFYCAVAGALPQVYRKRYSPERQSKAFIWAVVVIGVTPGIFLLLAAPLMFSIYLVILWFPLVFIVYMAATDWAEILDAMARSLLKSTADRVSIGWLAGTGMAVCCGSIFWMTISSDGAAWCHVPAMVGAAFFVVVVLRLSRVNKDWPMHFSWAGLAILIATFSLLMGVGLRAGAGKIPVVYPIYFSAVAGALLILFARRAQFAGIWAVLLFGVNLGMYMAVVGISRQGPTWTPIRGALLGIAVASVLGMFMLPWLRKGGMDVRAPLFNTILLNVGCLALYGLAFGVYEGAMRAGKQRDLIEAIVVFIAIGWDVLSSGHSITNIDGTLFSRRSRIYLFLGYVLLITAAVVFWSSIETDQKEWKEFLKLFGNPEAFVQLGIVIYGPATLLTIFLLRVARWLPSRRERPAALGQA